MIDFRVDIGLIEGPCHNVDIIAEPWLEDELVVFASPASSLLQGEVTLERLAQAQWILREQGSGTREIVDYLLLSHLPHFQLGMELGNSEAIKHAVRHGLASAVFHGESLLSSLRRGRWWKFPFRSRNWCARCGAFTIVRNTSPARCSVFCAIAKSKRVPHPNGEREKLCFTYNPGRVMKLSYN